MTLALSVTHAAPTCSEQELIAAVRRGDDRAFEVLYARYHRRIVSYVNGMVGDHARAEDITQDVFISALRRLRANDRPIMFKPWLYEVAKNACIDEFRRARRGQEVPLERDDALIDANPRLASRAPTPETAVESKQKLTDLRGAFGGLSESHHKVIVMRELEGLSYSQIGEQLGMSQAVVESTLFRARRRLGEEYEDLVSGRRCERVRAVVDEGESRTTRSIGIKERRLIARHLAHCQPCRRHARLAGVEDSLFEQPRLVGKIAALLPIPAWLRLRRGGNGSTAPSPSHSVGLIQSVQGLAATNPAAIGGLGRAAAAAVTLVIAGAGTGIVSLGSVPGRSGVTPRSAAPAAAGFTGSSARRAFPAQVPSAGRLSREAGRRGTHRAAASAVRLSSPSRPGARSLGVPATGLSSGRRAGASGTGHHLNGSGVPAGHVGAAGGAASGTGLPAAPAVPVPTGIGLPKIPTVAVPGLTKSAVADIPAPVNAGTLSVGGGTGRTGTASGAPGPVRRAVEALGGSGSR
jgi:RNA polymerase sigma factor (sigma-70 family)